MRLIDVDAAVSGVVGDRGVNPEAGIGIHNSPGNAENAEKVQVQNIGNTIGSKHR
jgi:hypothetical protein